MTEEQRRDRMAGWRRQSMSRNQALEHAREAFDNATNDDERAKAYARIEAAYSRYGR